MSTGYQSYHTLTIATGSNVSNVLAGSSVDTFEELTFYVSGSVAPAGTLYLQSTWTGSNDDWKIVTRKDGTQVTLAATDATIVDTIGSVGYRVSSSVVESGIVIKSIGSYDVSAKVIPR